MSNFDWQTKDIRWYAVAISIFLSLITLLFPDLPNDDAYVYFRTAEIFLSDGFAAAREHYSWPIYSLLIALLSKIGISLYTSALLLNSLFFALLVWTFISIVMMLTESKLSILLAAATILLYPELNEFRSVVIRDVGFWAFSLVAVWQLLSYQRTPNIASALSIIFALLLAATLRIEALVYLALIPMLPVLAHLLPHWFSTAQAGEENSAVQTPWYLLPALVYGGGVLAILVLTLVGVNLFAIVSGFLSSYTPFINELFSNDPAQSAQLQEQLIASHGELVGQFNAAGPLLGPIAVLISTLVMGMSGAYLWLLVFGAAKRYWPTASTMTAALAIWVAINALIVIGFLVLTGFLTSRYVMLMCLVIATQIPFVVVNTLDQASGAKHEKRARYLLVLFFIFCFFDAHISFGRSKSYLQDAADYVAVHSEAGQEILTNNHSIAWASGLIENYDEVNRVPEAAGVLSLPGGNYLALELIPQVRSLLADDEISEAVEFVTAFPSEAQQRVAIYRRR